MKAIISIGGQEYLLKSDKSAQTVMKALDGARKVLMVSDGYCHPRSEILLFDREAVETSLRLLPEKTKIRVYEPDPDPELDELLGLPEHGQMLLLPEQGTRQD
jgi:hypothetical protein